MKLYALNNPLSYPRNNFIVLRYFHVPKLSMFAIIPCGLVLILTVPLQNMLLELFLTQLPQTLNGCLIDRVVLSDPDALLERSKLGANG